MMKQPKHFYKSGIPGVPKVPVTLTPKPTDDDAVITPSTVSRTIRVSPKILFGIGSISLVALTILCVVPTLHVAVPIQLSLAKANVAPLVLEQKGNAGVTTGLQYDAKTADARVDIVANFLTRYNSPLKPADHYGQVLVDTADRYGLDYRLLPAIMMQESNLCKASDPAIHNCLGFGIHKNGTLAFATYEESFDRAARELKERYIDQGLTTPAQIMTKYTPSSNGSWAASVNQWIAEMEFNSRQKGVTSTQDMDLTAYSK
jgi:hypothetical protein